MSNSDIERLYQVRLKSFKRFWNRDPTYIEEASMRALVRRDMEPKKDQFTLQGEE